MQRRFSASWLTLLAAFLAGRLLLASPGGSGQAAAEPFGIKPLPDYSVYQALPPQAVKAPALSKREAGSIGRALPSHQTPKLFAARQSAGKQSPYSSFTAGSARRFTPFPTGPPLHH